MDDKTGIYDGVCRYCGKIERIIAESQDTADNLVTERCNCMGATIDRRLEANEKNARAISQGEPSEITDMLIRLANMILYKKISAVQISIEKTKYKIAENGKGQIEFTKTETEQTKLQE